MRWKNVLFYILCLYAFYNAFVALDGGFSSMADAQPTITIDEMYVDNERLDVGGLAYFRIHFVYTSNGYPLQFGTVFFENQPPWAPLGQSVYFGLCVVPVTSLDVCNYSLTVDRIYKGVVELDFQQVVPDPWCVFDKVLVDLKTSKPRIGVNTEASIRWTATHAFDGTPFQGQIILNETLTSPTVGKRAYQVTEIIDEQYGLTEFESDTLEIISDKVSVSLNASQERIDVGSEAEIEWTATYEYDQTPFHGWIEFNDALVQDEVGRYWYTVESVGDAWYDVESFSSNAVDVIFDEVEVEITTDDSRINVGEEANITLHAIYGFNSKRFEGDITMNRDDFSSNTVGSKTYFVEEIHDPNYGLTAFSSDELEVIWDHIKLELEAVDDRIDIGEEAAIQWTGTYESDGSSFDGTIEFSTDVLTLDSVGDIVYEVSRVIDPIYGISSFSSNTVKVVWDSVDVSFEFPHGRTEVGTEPELAIEALHEYDGKVFSGTVHLNDTLVKNDLGRHWFTVSSIEDRRYGITGFVSNQASCIWDGITIEKRISSNIPGSVQVGFNLFYEYDDRPVENAIVYVNGKLCRETGTGTYIQGLTNLLPILPIKVQIEHPGFSEEYSFGIQFCLGNIGLYTVVAAIVGFYARGMLKKA